MTAMVDEPLRIAVDALSSLEARVPARDGEVRLDRDGDVAWIRLDNPRAHNALTVTMMRQLGQALVDLQGWEGAIVAVASAGGGTFCAGGHLGQVRQSLVEPAAARLMTECMTTVLDALHGLPQVVVAVVEGAAIGGGAELTTACDLRVGSPAATVHFAQVPLGVVCGWGGGSRLMAQVGRRRALRVLAAGEIFSAEAALSYGLLDAVGPGDAPGLLRLLLGPMFDHDPAAVRAAKAQILAAGDPAAQADAFLSVWGGEAHRRALGR